jgi:hypothetical protein
MRRRESRAAERLRERAEDFDAVQHRNAAGAILTRRIWAGEIAVDQRRGNAA